jgi:hypothetical protein
MNAETALAAGVRAPIRPAGDVRLVADARWDCARRYGMAGVRLRVATAWFVGVVGR